MFQEASWELWLSWLKSWISRWSWASRRSNSWTNCPLCPRFCECGWIQQMVRTRRIGHGSAWPSRDWCFLQQVWKGWKRSLIRYRAWGRYFRSGQIPVHWRAGPVLSVGVREHDRRVPPASYTVWRNQQGCGRDFLTPGGDWFGPGFYSYVDGQKFTPFTVFFNPVNFLSIHADTATRETPPEEFKKQPGGRINQKPAKLRIIGQKRFPVWAKGFLIISVAQIKLFVLKVMNHLIGYNLNPLASLPRFRIFHRKT